MVRRQKLRRLRTAGIDSCQGKTVLFERYPLFYPFGDDHQPSLHNGAISLPDVLVLLEISESTALLRRAKDRADVISAKVRAFSEVVADLKSCGTRVLVCAESDSVETRVITIVDALDEVFSERARA